jgi:uncharacterized protein (TIGR02466 family)
MTDDAFDPNRSSMAEGPGALPGGGIALRWHFAVPIYDKLLPRFFPRQESTARSILALRDAGRDLVRSNRGGWHSHDRLHLTKDPDLAWLMHALTAVATACITDFEQGRPPIQVAMVSAWANVNEREDWNLPHVHLPLHWSGVFYVQVDDEAEGEVIFLNPLPLGERWKRDTGIHYRPRTGMMLLFPAFLTHMVAPHRSDRPRISVAFNLRVQPAKP